LAISVVLGISPVVGTTCADILTGTEENDTIVVTPGVQAVERLSVNTQQSSDEFWNIVLVEAALYIEKVQRYSTLCFMVENEPLIWANRHRFYDLGFAAWTCNITYVKQI
jgi:hypothetical protein